MSWKEILKEDKIKRMVESISADKKLFGSYFNKLSLIAGFLEEESFEMAEEMWKRMQDIVKDVEGLGYNKDIHRYLNEILFDEDRQ